MFSWRQTFICLSLFVPVRTLRSLFTFCSLFIESFSVLKCSHCIKAEDEVDLFLLPGLWCELQISFNDWVSLLILLLPFSSGSTLWTKSLEILIESGSLQGFGSRSALGCDTSVNNDELKVALSGMIVRGCSTVFETVPVSVVGTNSCVAGIVVEKSSCDDAWTLEINSI